MKPKLSLLITLSILLPIASICAAPGKKPPAPANLPSTAEPLTVAVLPFKSANLANLNANERVVRDFERSYLAARLVRSLQGTAGIGQTYFSPGWTPAADLNVNGTIKKSDGKMTVVNIELASAEGRRIWNKDFSVNTSVAEFKRAGADPSGRLWPQVAMAVAQTKRKPGDLLKAQIAGYAGSNAPVVTATSVKTAAEGAGVERRGMLAPATEKLASRARAADETYLLWQRNSTPLVEQRSQEKTAQTLNMVASFLGGVSMGLGAATGNTSATTSGAQTIQTASANYEVSQQKVLEINKALSVATQSMAWTEKQPRSVRVFDKLYTFTGSMEKQQAELRKVVASKIRETAGSSVAALPAASKKARP